MLKRRQESWRMCNSWYPGTNVTTIIPLMTALTRREEPAAVSQNLQYAKDDRIPKDGDDIAKKTTTPSPRAQVCHRRKESRWRWRQLRLLLCQSTGIRCEKTPQELREANVTTAEIAPGKVTTTYTHPRWASTWTTVSPTKNDVSRSCYDELNIPAWHC